MDTSTIIPLVSVVATALIGFILWLVERIINSKSKMNILKNQLNNFYAPIYNDLITGNIKNYKHLLSTVANISKDFPNDIPQYFLNFQKDSHFVHDMETPLDEEVKKHIMVNYNWLRKKFGYDVSEKIDAKDYCYLDFFKKKNNILEFFDFFLAYSPLMLFVISAYFFEKNSITIGYAFLFSALSSFITRLLTNYLNKWKS